MKHASKTAALAAGALLVLSLGGCGKKEQTAEQATIDPAAGAAQEPGGIGGTGGGVGTAGTAAMTSQAITGYLGETGADTTGRAFALDQVTFDSGSSTLDAADQQVLGEVAAALSKHPNASVTVTSYADPAGDAAANKKLAAARAVAVKNALSTAGVPAARLMTNVVGETGNAAVAANRKVELLVKRG